MGGCAGFCGAESLSLDRTGPLGPSVGRRDDAKNFPSTGFNKGRYDMKSTRKRSQTHHVHAVNVQYFIARRDSGVLIGRATWHNVTDRYL
jgi:hypothetical protein